MKKSRVVLIVLLGLVVSLAVVMYVLRTVEDSSARSTAERTEPDPSFPRIVGSADQIHLKGVNYTHIKDGRAQWILKADNGCYLRGQSRLDLGKLKITFFPVTGGKVILTADKGVFDRRKNVMVVTGNVHTVDQTGQHLYTERLVYRTNQKGRRIFSTDLPVQFKGPRMNIKGQYGMTGQVDLQKVTLHKRVRSKFTSPPQAKPGRSPVAKGGPR
ncbi:MAG: LPS export ABC transporter periplasmic protein LptC [Proteobacteria bacterium]|nr:LPS export ABC transporter periplasmic protein LptC [Pseudomonadota bacterium]MBU1742409.1 LPS export ABC transporter periplasmic protein LptC [Pseudomonadota bacterium]